MKSVAIYSLGTILLSPSVVLLCCDNVVGVLIGIVWGTVLYHSPKFSPMIKKFWLKFWKINLQIMYYFV